MPLHLVAFKVLVNPVILQVHVATDVSLAALEDKWVKVEFQDLLMYSECVLQVLLILKTDIADSPVEGLAIEATVNLRHELLKSLMGYKTRHNTVAVGLDSGNDFTGCTNHRLTQWINLLPATVDMFSGLWVLTVSSLFEDAKLPHSRATASAYREPP